MSVIPGQVQIRESGEKCVLGEAARSRPLQAIEWQDSRSLLSQQSMALLDPTNQDRLTNRLTEGLAA